MLDVKIVTTYMISLLFNIFTLYIIYFNDSLVKIPLKKLLSCTSNTQKYK